MYFFFVLIAIIGISYLSVSIMISQNPTRYKNKFRQQLSPERLTRPFQSKKMQSVLDKAGFNISSKKVNLFRFFVTIGILFVSYGSAIFKGNELTFWPVLYCVIFLFCTSSLPFTPSGWILRKLHQRILIQKDGELIAFIKLYENNRAKQSGYVQFDAFCQQIAPHFKLLGDDLRSLSERVVEDGLEEGLDWFVSRFPKNHPFIYDIRSILITAESIGDYEGVMKHLKSHSSMIAKISSDQYERRWKFIGDIATIFTSLPSVLIFVMVVTLVLMYVQIIRSNLDYVNIG